MKRGGKNIYHVIIQGTRSPGSLLLAERLKTMGNIVEVLDESRPAYDIEKLKEQYRGTLIGDYIERFKDPGHRPVAEGKALYHGLQALLNASVLVNGRVMQDAQQKDLGRIPCRCSRCHVRDIRCRWSVAIKKIFAEKQKLRRSIEQLNREIHELEEQRTEMRVKEDSLRKLEGVHGEGLTEEHIHTLSVRIRYRKRRNLYDDYPVPGRCIDFEFILKKLCWQL